MKKPETKNVIVKDCYGIEIENTGECLQNVKITITGFNTKGKKYKIKATISIDWWAGEIAKGLKKAVHKHLEVAERVKDNFYIKINQSV